MTDEYRLEKMSVEGKSVMTNENIGPLILPSGPLGKLELPFTMTPLKVVDRSSVHLPRVGVKERRHPELPNVRLQIRRLQIPHQRSEWLDSELCVVNLLHMVTQLRRLILFVLLVLHIPTHLTIRCADSVGNGALPDPVTQQIIHLLLLVKGKGSHAISFS